MEASDDEHETGSSIGESDPEKEAITLEAPSSEDEDPFEAKAQSETSSDHSSVSEFQ